MIDNQLLIKFSHLIQEKTGIHIPEHKLFILENKLIRFSKKEGYNDFEDIYKSLRKNDELLIDLFIRYITTNHTFFFRENDHFRLLIDDIRLNKHSKPLIWVAGSSSGEEVYSIVITLYEHGINNFLIIATDIDREVLVKMKNGIYTEDRVKNVEKGLLKKYFLFNAKNNTYKIKDILRKNVRIKRLNFIENITFEGKFDYVFCRNVLIYFDKITQKKVIVTLLKNLHKHGLLFLGHSENLFYMQDIVIPMKNSIYRKKDDV